MPDDFRYFNHAVNNIRLLHSSIQNVISHSLLWEHKLAGPSHEQNLIIVGHNIDILAPISEQILSVFR